MARYNFKCSDCYSTEELTLSVAEFLSSKDKEGFNTRECKKCNATTEFIRIFNSISSKISRSKDEISAIAKEDVRKIVEKVKSGDMKTILDVYGEKK
jgi:hypothetical protein